MKLTTFLSIVIAETILTIVCILAIGFIAGCIREERREDGEWPQIRRVDGPVLVTL
jgi:hypothetical protein